MLAKHFKLQSAYLGPNRKFRTDALRTGPRRVLVTRPLASAKADQALQQAKTKYDAGDRLKAMKLYEDALAEGPTTEQRLKALYGQTAVHAAFGDIELAKMTLREGVSLGMDYDAMTADPENVKIVASPQMEIQLKRFAKQVRTSIDERRSAGPTPVRPRVPVDMRDLDSIIGSSSSAEPGVDTSIPAILRRVALVLLAAVTLGTTLFFLGLEYAFPKV